MACLPSDGTWPQLSPISHADERLRRRPIMPFQFEIALHRDQTDAILRRVDHDLVIDSAVTEIEIAWPEMSAGGQSSPKRTSHFEAGVRVLDHFVPDRDFRRKTRVMLPSGIEWDKASSALSISMIRPGNCARNAADRARRLARRRLAPTLSRQKGQLRPISPRR